ncbi:lytic transglycosylase domain-containing protein [Burkholderia sp. Ac-20365]|jgi:soluble lytic murein transglycosylase-like protein|uniref:lytic transglycosylase domain-containing protein n=1 Tax=Burkholderia sp. Ac-20365 TaxID=2703897 RepID=UPI001F121696|nr:lytic transglycosylase domain-containing protein [Burkholderia sp. Ac-20365]
MALVCVVNGGAAHAVEMVIGGGKDLDAAGGPLIVEFGVPVEARGGALSKVLAWAAVVDAVAARMGVDRALLMAVIDVESGGNPFAVSPKGARGLMQLMPKTGLAQGADDLFDPYQNVVAGSKLLDTLLVMYGDVALALAAYNAGEAAVRKYGGMVPPYVETQRYVRRVMERVEYYRR